MRSRSEKTMERLLDPNDSEKEGQKVGWTWHFLGTNTRNDATERRNDENCKTWLGPPSLFIHVDAEYLPAMCWKSWDKHVKSCCIKIVEMLMPPVWNKETERVWSMQSSKPWASFAWFDYFNSCSTPVFFFFLIKNPLLLNFFNHYLWLLVTRCM
jgi:hypothetical protein